jgi:hypothetical protein
MNAQYGSIRQMHPSQHYDLRSRLQAVQAFDIPWVHFYPGLGRSLIPLMGTFISVGERRSYCPDWSQSEFHEIILLIGETVTTTDYTTSGSLPGNYLARGKSDVYSYIKTLLVNRFIARQLMNWRLKMDESKNVVKLAEDHYVEAVANLEDCACKDEQRLHIALSEQRYRPEIFMPDHRPIKGAMCATSGRRCK